MLVQRLDLIATPDERIARTVRPLHHDGGQAQYVGRPIPPVQERVRLASLLHVLRACLARRTRVSPPIGWRVLAGALGCRANSEGWSSSDGDVGGCECKPSDAGSDV